MKESKIKKLRKCKSCGKEIYGDAKRMVDHDADHALADRAAKSGLVLPDFGIVTR